jgi:hypothetical protein
MAQPKYIEKSLRMTTEITRIFDDLDEYRDYCRFNMLKFNEKDLYKSEQYRKFDKWRRWDARNRQQGYAQ